MKYCRDLLSHLILLLESHSCFLRAFIDKVIYLRICGMVLQQDSCEQQAESGAAVQHRRPCVCVPAHHSCWGAGGEPYGG